MDRPEMLSRIRAFCARPGASVLFDEPSDALWDVPSGKPLPLRAPELIRVEERRNAQTGSPYLWLRYGDGRELALSEAGVAFPPDFSNSGPLPELPAAVCLKDFRGLLDRLEHALYGHPDAPVTADMVTLVMMCIAILDGARSAGFDVGREEREVERQLEEIERRR